MSAEVLYVCRGIVCLPRYGMSAEALYVCRGTVCLSRHCMSAEVLYVCRGTVCLPRYCMSAEVLYVCRGTVCLQRYCMSAEALYVCRGTVCLPRYCMSADALYICRGTVCLQRYCMSGEALYVCWDNGSNSLQWRHDEHDGVSNHQPHDCLLNRLIRRRSKKTSKLRVIGHCKGNSPVTGEFPAQRASNAANVSMWWRHHDGCRLESMICRTCEGIISVMPSPFLFSSLLVKPLTHCDRVTPYGVWGFSQHWFRYCNCTLKDSLQWNSNQNTIIFIQENEFENVVCKMVAIYTLLNFHGLPKVA